MYEVNEKEQIEKATVDAFVDLHNKMHGTFYSVREYGDHQGARPDAICATADGEVFNVEVTITEDRSGDIPLVLGKAKRRRYQGKLASCLQGNVFAQLTERLNKKSLMRYAGRTALVIRDSSGVDWDWEEIRPQVKEFLRQRSNPFHLGICPLHRGRTTVRC